jgi:hypothetical protein
MNRVGIAFSSKDRPELTRKTIEPLLQKDKFDLHWVDGSKTDAGRYLFLEEGVAAGVEAVHQGITGGSCRAIVYALTTMLGARANKSVPGRERAQYWYDYTHVGLVENDVLLDPDWFEPTMELFEIGEKAGLKVGAVSARTYEDRVLIQCDGYAVMHNIGAGMQIFTREAAELILQQYRTGMTGENRKTFSILSGIDIGGFWAFRGSEHMLVADWTWDHMLAKHGMCSLALTPAKAEQLEDIDAMGLKMVREPIEARRDLRAFELFSSRLAVVRERRMDIQHLANDHLYDAGQHIIFPHQIPQIGGKYSGDWRFKWSMGYGCFSWKAGEDEPSLSVSIFGPCELLVSGGEKGGRIRVEDDLGFQVAPQLHPESEAGRVLQLIVPAAYAYRNVCLTALTPGITFYGIRCRAVQPIVPAKFDFNMLPPL